VDTYVDRIIKYIPTEIVAAWIAIKGIITGAAASSKDVAMWSCFVILAILTPFYIAKAAKLAGSPPPVLQAAISTGAFIVWCFALGAPFDTVINPANQSLFGSLLLIVYTLVIGLIIP
jgi:hypothetical protein